MKQHPITQTETRRSSQPKLDPVTRRPRVLLAEDDLEMRNLLQWEFSKNGFDVIECRDGYQLLAQLGTPPLAAKPESVDLIVSDIRMPGVTGLEILQALQETEWNLPMVLITAFGDDHTHRLADQYGAAAMFDKPFEISLLISRVREVLGLDNPNGSNWATPSRSDSHANQPVDVVFSRLPRMPEIEAIVNGAYAQLHPYTKNIVYCRAIVEGSRLLQNAGDKYHIQLMVTLPDEVLVIRSHMRFLGDTGSLHAAIRDAFGAMRGKLRRYFDGRDVN